MNNIKNKILFYLEVGLFVIMISGCREDFFDPNSKDVNVNEPITLDYYNSYTFMINANNISYYVVENTNLVDPLANLNIDIENYENGYIEIYVTDNNFFQMYGKKFDNNVQNLTEVLKGYSPERLVISFHNFTGNLKIELNTSL